MLSLQLLLAELSLMVPAVKELFIATHWWAISICKQTHSRFIPQELCLTHASLNSAEGFLSTSHPLETPSLAWSTSTPCSRRSTVIPLSVLPTRGCLAKSKLKLTAQQLYPTYMRGCLHRCKSCKLSADRFQNAHWVNLLAHCYHEGEVPLLWLPLCSCYLT